MKKDYRRSKISNVFEPDSFATIWLYLRRTLLRSYRLSSKSLTVFTGFNRSLQHKAAAAHSLLWQTKSHYRFRVAHLSKSTTYKHPACYPEE
jgi:hypothetical protein